MVSLSLEGIAAGGWQGPGRWAGSEWLQTEAGAGVRLCADATAIQKKAGLKHALQKLHLARAQWGPTRAPSAEMSLKRSLEEPASPSPRRKLAGDARFVQG